MRSLWANNGSHRSIVICFFQNEVLAVTRETCLRRSLWANNGSPLSIVLLNLRTQRSLTFVSGFPKFSDAVEDSADGALSLLRAIRFIIGPDFAVTLSSLDSFCVLFDIPSEHSARLKWLLLNKHKRWFHSSRVKFPLVSMSASWFLVSVYLIWILGSKLILSNNQSRATLWALETCLIVGLLLIIILITAPMSSNTYNKASLCENWTYEKTINIIQMIDHSSRLRTPVVRVRANNGSPRSIMVLSCVSKDKNNQIPQIESRNPV